jgi:hypothetical protein
MAFLIYGVVVVLVILAGLAVAVAFSRLALAVTDTRTALEREEKSYNPSVTLGHKIKVQADYEEQLEQARLVAAKKAAALPRGANLRIGRLGQSILKTASEGLEHDPQTTVRIARFHGWDGARTGIPAGGTAPAPVAVAGGTAAVAAPAAQEIELVPGRDYPVIEITDAMSPDERRKATIANSKAKSAAMKAAKAAQGGAVAPAAAGVAPPVAGVTMRAPAAAPATAGITPPKLIEITDAMSPEDRRKATIANSKAKSAYNKALKAAGVAPGGVEADELPVALPVDEGETAATAAPVAARSAGARPGASGITEPNYIQITDDMSPDQVRQARIQNSKLRSAHNKALKAAGIDPAAMEGDGEAALTPMTPQTTTGPSTPPPTVVAAPTPSGGAVAGIPRPDYIEISEGMSPDEVRQARIQNSKLRSAYNKALKAAGVDPATVE